MVSGIFSLAVWVAASITERPAPFSQVTKIVLASREKTMARGRGAVGIVCDHCSDVVSTAATALSASHVTYTIRPSGATVTPSGSPHTGTDFVTAPRSRSTTAIAAVSSFET